MDDHSIHILARQGIYKGKPLGAKLEETHISWILLADELVFKIKKPVKLSFLDFSELSARKTSCEKELTLNKRFSPIYLEVLPVMQNGELFEIGGENGNIIDYTVLMKRMPTACKMDDLLSLGKVGSDEIVALAEKVAEMHRNAPVVSHDFDQQAQIATFKDIESIKPVISKYATPDCQHIIDHSVSFADAFILQYADSMKERVHLGFYRDVHGDLHSGNIFIADRPIVFDCIEYNDAFRQIDVLNDIAFLCMDLEAFGQASLADIFLEIYTNQFPAFQTAEDNLIFLYYKCLRANIRAKVHAVSALETAGTASVQAHLQAAEKYLLLMNDYIVQVVA